MSNAGTSPLGTKAVVRTIVRGVAQTQVVAAEIIHRKPILTFTLRGQYEDERGELQWADIEFHFQIDPRQIRPEHNNRIQAVRDRLNAAQKTIEKMAAASGALGRAQSGQIRREDLPDTEILTELYEELDRALDSRLLAVVMLRGGQTMWDYVDENGNHVNLSPEILKSDLRMAEAIHTAFQEWYNPTKALSEAATSAKAADGTMDSTPATPKALSSDSDTRSTAPASKGKATGEATSPTGMNP